MKLLLFKILLFIPMMAYSAPWPATSSSVIFSSDYNYLLTFENVFISTKGLSWKNGENIHRWKQISGTGQLLLSYDFLQGQNQFNEQQKKWLKEYLSYGFEVLNQKSFTHTSRLPAQLFDLIHKDKNKQVRQFIFQNKQKLAILTCTDSPAQFQKTASECNQIVQTFTFTDPANTSPSVMQNK